MKIDNCELDARAVRCLLAEGLTNTGQLEHWCSHQLLKIPNLGRVTLARIELFLIKHGQALNKLKHYNDRTDRWGLNTKCYACIKKEGIKMECEGKEEKHKVEDLMVQAKSLYSFLMGASTACSEVNSAAAFKEAARLVSDLIDKLE